MLMQASAFYVFLLGEKKPGSSELFEAQNKPENELQRLFTPFRT